MGRRQAQDDPSHGWQDTHPGTHKARSSSFTRNTLENKNVWKSEDCLSQTPEHPFHSGCNSSDGGWESREPGLGHSQT